jgi:hypothetical protein
MAQFDPELSLTFYDTIMKTLKTKFRMNDLYYTLICKNDKVAI